MAEVITRTPLLDEPWRWGDPSIWPRPSFNVEEFQKKIDKIVGLSVRGDSIVKLRWMRDNECYEKIYTKWDLATPTDFDLRAKYKFTTIDLPDGNFVDIPPPRWVLEQRYEPEQIADEWEATRWENVDGLPRPIRDACPGGYYQWLWTIAEHTNCCEDGITEENTVCWGKYREPNEKDLTTLRAMMWRKNKDNLHTNPFEKVSESVETEMIRRANEAYQADHAKRRALHRDVVDDAVKQVIHKYTDDPSVLKHGKYRFVPSSYKSQIKNKKRRKQ